MKQSWTVATGLGAVNGDLLMTETDTDAWIELTSAFQALEWSIGLHADKKPTQVDGYNGYQNAEHLACLYSGFNRHSYISAAKKSVRF